MPNENSEVRNVMSSVSNESGCIANNLPGRPMRLSMENKALLAQKGSMYIGTGNVTTTTVTLEDDTTATYSVPITEAVVLSNGTWTPGNYVLHYDGTSFTWVKLS